MVQHQPAGDAHIALVVVIRQHGIMHDALVGIYRPDPHNVRVDDVGQPAVFYARPCQRTT